MTNLTVVKQAHFGTLAIDFYGDLRGEFYMTRDQIGAALEYANPMIAIQKIHNRHRGRMDKFSLTKMVNGRPVYFYTAKGVYELCRYSDKPKAHAFYDAVYEVLEGLRIGYLKLKAEIDSPIWQDTRSLGKEVRKVETEAIKGLVDYAKGQGSRNADRYYISLSKLADATAGIVDRDKAQTVQLTALLMVENIIAQQIAAGIAAGEPYKHIYRAVKDRLTAFRTVAALGA